MPTSLCADWCTKDGSPCLEADSVSICRPKNAKRRADWTQRCPERSASPPLGACRTPRHASVVRRAFVSLRSNDGHPHIGAIHGFEDRGETHALVLELVEGDTLADRIARGPMPPDEARHRDGTLRPRSPGRRRDHQHGVGSVAADQAAMAANHAPSHRERTARPGFRTPRAQWIGRYVSCPPQRRRSVSQISSHH